MAERLIPNAEQSPTVESSVEPSKGLDIHPPAYYWQWRPYILGAIAFVLLVVPVVLIRYESQFSRDAQFFTAVGLFGCGVLTLCGVWFFHKNSLAGGGLERSKILQYMSEYRYWFNHLLTVWIVTGGSCAILAAVFVVLPKPTDHIGSETPQGHINADEHSVVGTETPGKIIQQFVQHARAAMYFHIYITVLGYLLAVKFLVYRNLAPIIDVEELLTRLHHDLRDNYKAGGRLWFVFPGLNIGFYRFRKQIDANPVDHVYSHYKEWLQKWAKRLRQKAVAVTYSVDRCRELFECYAGADPGESMTHLGDPKATAKKCADESEEFCKAFRGEAPNFQYGRHVELEPDEFPQPVIIIGNIVYMILSYGLPLYDYDGEGKGRFQSIQDEKGVVDIIAYRREDPILADVIAEHLGKLVDDRSRRKRHSTVAIPLLPSPDSSKPILSHPVPEPEPPKAE